MISHAGLVASVVGVALLMFSLMVATPLNTLMLHGFRTAARGMLQYRY